VRSPYASLFTRLVANTAEPDNERACWLWTGKRRCRYGYPKTTLYVPGLRKTVSLYAHVLLYVALEANATTGDDAWLAYQELQASGLELDHLCEVPSCIFFDHLEPVTPRENCARRDRRA
jgi:hypothetical protein